MALRFLQLRSRCTTPPPLLKVRPPLNVRTPPPSLSQRIVDESSEFLPLVYDPDKIAAYWGKRQRAVATRIVQLLSVAGGFISRLGWDLINNKIKENEVARAIELRKIVTSLGPAYIKLGQALSIRPDILSSSAMVKLQKHCHKVPSFPDDVATSLLEEEFGQLWYNVYSELFPKQVPYMLVHVRRMGNSIKDLCTEGIFVCTVCNKDLHKPNELKVHYEREHKDEDLPYECDCCRKRWATEEERTEHECPLLKGESFSAYMRRRKKEILEDRRKGD